MSAFNLFGVPIEGIAFDEAFEASRRKGRSFWIVTANPEILLEARCAGAYASILKQADVRMVDGFGLWLILRLFGYKTHRVAGVEIAERLIQLAQREQWRIAFIGGAPGVAEEAARNTADAYHDIQIHAEEGGMVGLDGSDDATGVDARRRITNFAPDILLVAFGHPKQEQWIAKHIKEFPGLKVVVGVGGTFDYWSGVAMRAPMFFRALGLEWLWRLLREPKRVRRIIRAVFVFPILAITDRLGHNPQ